jgi:hypothetical protein
MIFSGAALKLCSKILTITLALATVALSPALCHADDTRRDENYFTSSSNFNLICTPSEAAKQEVFVNSYSFEIALKLDKSKDELKPLETILVQPANQCQDCHYISAYSAEDDVLYEAKLLYYPPSSYVHSPIPFEYSVELFVVNKQNQLIPYIAKAYCIKNKDFINTGKPRSESQKIFLSSDDAR